MATYLVTQATGGQSRWVITHLLEAGCKVHAVVRDLKKVQPILQNPNIKLFQGESKNFDDIFTAAQGCKGVFLNTFPIPGLELLQAQTIVDACKKAGVESVVASTTRSAGNRAAWNISACEDLGLRAYFSSKAAVEDTVRASGFKFYTIIRAGFIHFDYYRPGSDHNYPSLPERGELVHSFNEGARMIHTDAHDIGKWAAAALLDPAKFTGQDLDIGDELLSVEEVSGMLERVTGRKIPTRRRTPEEVEEAKTTLWAQSFQLWANIRDFSADVAAAKELPAKFGIPFTPIEEAFRRDRALIVDGLPPK
ncbi:NmrA family protein [Xylariales sp. PMI_506]|nr:NmrA family protein [Xylariales sp. PMI_506]